MEQAPQQPGARSNEGRWMSTMPVNVWTAERAPYPSQSCKFLLSLLLLGLLPAKFRARRCDGWAEEEKLAPRTKEEDQYCAVPSPLCTVY
jgi:hypothetical protein